MEYKEHAFTVHGREIRFSHAQDIYNAIEQQFWPRYNETSFDTCLRERTAAYGTL